MKYVYHSPVEPPPAPNASGNYNTVRVGAMQGQRLGVLPTPAGNPSAPALRVSCPSWGCGEPPMRGLPSPYPGPVMGPTIGSTSTVPQPPPPSIPWGGWQTNAPMGIATPAPAPTVPAPTPLSNTNPGTPLSSTGSSVSGWTSGTALNIGFAIVDSLGNIQEVTSQGTTGVSLPNFNTNPGGTTPDGTVIWTNQGPSTGSLAASAGLSSITNWLSSSTIVSGLPNWGIAAALAFAGYLMMGKKR